MARPQKKYDPAIASEIQKLRAQGVSVKDVSSLIGISERSARKLYQSELDKGKSQANAAIAGKIFELAMQGNTACLIFWAKTQLYWQEKAEDKQGADIEALKKGIASAFNSVGNGGQTYGVLVTPGIMSEEEWQKEADKYAQARQENE